MSNYTWADWKANARRMFREAFTTYSELKGDDTFGAGGQSRTRTFAGTIDRLIQFHRLRKEAQTLARQDLANIIGPDAEASDYELFVRWLDAADREEDFARTMQPTLVATRQENQARLAMYDTAVQNNPVVQGMIQRYLTYTKGMWNDYIARGMASSLAERRTYWIPHEILDLPEMRKGAGASGFRQATPNAAKFRKGTARNKNLNLIDVLERSFSESISKMKQYDLVQDIAKANDVLQNPGKFTDLNGVPLTLKAGDTVPEGFVVRDLRSGMVGLRWGSFADRLVGDIIDKSNWPQMAKALGVSDLEFQTAVRRYTGQTVEEQFNDGLGPTQIPQGDFYVVLPREVDNAIHRAFREGDIRRVRDASKYVAGTRITKGLYLNTNPIRYNVNNIIGDFERMYAQFGNEALDGEAWQAALDSVREFYANGHTTPLMQQAIDYGVSSSGRTAADQAPTLSDPRMFNLQFPGQVNSFNQLRASVRNVLSTIPAISSAREDLFRIAVMEMNNKRLARGEGPLMGVADKELVAGLIDEGDLKRVSAYVARKSLGDYGDFTLFEDGLRGLVVPFYAWAKINTTFWPAVFKEAAAAGGAGRVAGVAATKAARHSAMAAAKGLAATTLGLATMRAWNETVFGEYEDEIGEDTRRQSLIIVPDVKHFLATGEFIPLRKPDGDIATWAMRDALDDFWTVTGFDRVVPEAMAILRGTLTTEEAARRHLDRQGAFNWKAPVRYAINQLGPVVQGPMAAVGMRTFPDPFDPYQVAPDQRVDAVLEMTGLKGIPGMTPVTEFATNDVMNWGQVYQPRNNVLDVFESVGFKSHASPSMMTESGMNRYKADLVKRLERVEAEIQATEGRMDREFSGVSNRSLDDEVRRSRFDTRMKHIVDVKLQEVARLRQRMLELDRTLNKQQRAQ